MSRAARVAVSSASGSEGPQRIYNYEGGLIFRNNAVEAAEHVKLSRGKEAKVFRRIDDRQMLGQRSRDFEDAISSIFEVDIQETPRAYAGS
jgi:hypothetical protein